MGHQRPGIPSSLHEQGRLPLYQYAIKFDIAGKRDDEFPADWAESAADFVEHDKMTEISRDRVAVIETHYWYGKDSLTPFISEKLLSTTTRKKSSG
jgi:hypothetical protein